MPLPVYRTIPDMRAQVVAWKADGLRVGLVPTMVLRGRSRADKVSDALQRCERALSRVPAGWIESPRHQTRQDTLAAAARERAVEAMRAAIQAKAQAKAQKEAAARAAEALAAEKVVADRQ